MGITIVMPAVPSEFLVDNRVYTDPKLFDDERERLFCASGISFATQAK